MKLIAEPEFALEAFFDTRLLDDEISLTDYFCRRAREFLAEKGVGDRKLQLMKMVIIVDPCLEGFPVNGNGEVRVVGRFTYFTVM